MQAVNRSSIANFECLVVDDGCSDGSAAIAAQGGARVLRVETQRGPASARNLGARAARGGVLLFIDSDVSIEPETLARIESAFDNDPALDALIGSYDDDPAEPNFLSQYKNLMHRFVHQHGKRRASTFWTGCGAIRRAVFLEAGGFDERYVRPSIEDIELGRRLIGAGRKIELDAELTVKHLKRWTLSSLLESDIRYRAIPWTRLLLRERKIPDDLNIERSQRVSVASAYVAIGMAPIFWPVSLLAAGIVIALNRRFYRFLAGRRGAMFALRAIPLHFAYFVYSGAAFAAACVMSLPIVLFPSRRSQPIR